MVDCGSLFTANEPTRSNGYIIINTINQLCWFVNFCDVIFSSLRPNCANFVYWIIYTIHKRIECLQYWMQNILHEFSNKFKWWIKMSYIVLRLFNLFPCLNHLLVNQFAWWNLISPILLKGESKYKWSEYEFYLMKLHLW